MLEDITRPFIAVPILSAMCLASACASGQKLTDQQALEEQELPPEIIKLFGPWLNRKSEATPPPAQTTPCEKIHPIRTMGRISVAECARALAADSGVSVPIKGSVLGPFTPLVTGSTIYAEALRYLPKIKTLPREVRRPLLREWDGIKATRAKLLSEGRKLDAEDEKLYIAALRLVCWKNAIARRAELMKAHRLTVEQKSVGRSPSQDEDAAWKEPWGRENKCITAHTAEISRFNAAVDRWIETSGSLELKAGSAERFSDPPASTDIKQPAEK